MRRFDPDVLTAYVAFVLFLAILVTGSSTFLFYQPIQNLVPVSFLDGRHEKPR